MAGCRAIGSRATTEPLVRFLVLHEPMDVQFHCVIIKRLQLKRKFFFSPYKRLRHSTGSSQGANKARLNFAKKTFKKHFWKIILWMPHFKFNLHQNERSKKVWRRLETAHDLKHATLSVKHAGALRWHENTWFPVVLGYLCLVMMWQRTEAARLILKCTWILWPDSVKWSKVYWAALHSTNWWWPKTYSKSNPGVFEGKKVGYSAMAKSISWYQPDWPCISLAEDKTKGRKTHKQTTTEVSCSKDLVTHHKGRNPISGDVHEFQT